MVLQHSPYYLTSQVNGYMEYTHVTCCLEFLVCYNCWNSTLNTLIHMQFYFLLLTVVRRDALEQVNS